ncbi:MAG: hypothetical protein HZC22_02950 [Rhodocyclales bacterium]|nr:hypothetical protein [Rhodocyclales bacterium]
MRLAAAAAAALALCACGSSSVKSIPSSGTLIPNYTLQVAPSISVALEKVVYWGALAGIAYLVLDPLAPNWDIEEAPLGANHIHFSLRMKRFYAGGAGEAHSVFHRRAKELMRLNGFDGYKVVEYEEALESSVLGSQRTAVGVVMLTRKAAS